MKVFVVDVSICNGCHNCQLGCKDEHVDNEWLPYAKPQPDTGQFWVKVEETVHGSVPKVKIQYKPLICNHCENAACIKAAQDGAVYRRNDGLVIIDPIKAVGQKQIAEACPYDSIYWNEALNLPQKCTGCAHLVDEGKVPHCVDLCPHGALKFGEEEEFRELIAQAEVMKPEFGLKPRVFYLNLPKFFVGGEVWDPEADECLERAIVTLKNTVTGESYRESTDCFGDFWFNKLDKGTYSLRVDSEGFCPFVMDNLNVEKSVNVGDIALKRAL